jgi:hypothetical protein
MDKNISQDRCTFCVGVVLGGFMFAYKLCREKKWAVGYRVNEPRGERYKRYILSLDINR